MLIVQYKIFSALRADENGVCMCMQSKLTYQTHNMIFLCASRGLRFTSLLILCGAILMKWSILSERKWLGMGPFLILTNIDGGDVEEIGHFQSEKLRSHGNIFHIIANFVWRQSWWNDRFQRRKMALQGTQYTEIFLAKRAYFLRENWL